MDFVGVGLPAPCPKLDTSEGFAPVVSYVPPNAMDCSPSGFPRNRPLECVSGPSFATEVKQPLGDFYTSFQPTGNITILGKKPNLPQCLLQTRPNAKKNGQDEADLIQ